MSDEAFVDLKEALESALAFERGERRDLRMTRIPPPRRRNQCGIKALLAHDKPNCWQAVFCDDAQHQA